MAPASDTALGINEIVSIILSCLPKKHLKSARLVNKIWASLGGQMLIGTLYISPREIDMAAFDGITRHADLSKSVKHVVYDTAQFKKYDNFAVYYAVLDKAFQNNAFLHLGSAQSRMDQFCSRVDRLQWELYETDVWNLRDSDSDSNANTGFDDPEFEVYWTHPTFIDGYQQYLVHAAESCNIFRPLWGARVVRGLKALGPIFSFAFENTWNAIYAADGYSHYMYDDFIILEDTRDSNTDRLVRGGLILSDGTRLIGSPSARAWCPTGIPPSSPKPVQPPTNSKAHIMKNGMSDGYWEFVQLLELLSAANKIPQEFRARGDIEINTGLPVFTFNMQHFHATKLFKDLAKELKVLILNMVSCGSDPTVRNPNLFVLERWIDEVEHATTYPEICSKDKLEVLSLTVPLCSEVSNPVRQYELTAIVKNIKEWIRPNLTRLHLAGFAIDFEDLERLLCVNLPKLRSLQLEFIKLKGGIWDDIVE